MTNPASVHVNSLFSCRSDDKVFLRNHYPRRTVLGIIARDGALAEYVSLPAKNLFVVPDEVTDEEAVFTEPLAAACRILEQQVGMIYPVKQQQPTSLVCNRSLSIWRCLQILVCRFTGGTH